MYYSIRNSTVALEIGTYPQIQQFDPKVDFADFHNTVSEPGNTMKPEARQLRLVLEKNAILTDVLSLSSYELPLINAKTKELFSRFHVQGISFGRLAEVLADNSPVLYYFIIPAKPAYECLDLEKSVFARYAPELIGEPSEFEFFNSTTELEKALESNKSNAGTARAEKHPLVIWKPVFKSGLETDLFSLDYTFQGRKSLFISNKLKDQLIAQGITGAGFELI